MSRVRIFTLGFALLVNSLVIAGCEAISGGEDSGIHASGVIQVREISIAPEISGVVAEVLVEEGDTVQKGDMLFRLEGEVLQAQREAAESTVEAAQIQVESAEAAQQSAELSLERAQHQWLSAQLQLDLERASAIAQDQPGQSRVWAGIQVDLFDQPDWYFGESAQIEAARSNLEQAEGRYQQAQAEFESLVEDLGSEELEEALQQLARARSNLLILQQIYYRPVVGEDGEWVRDELSDQYDQARDDLEEAQDRLEDLLNTEEADEILEGRARVSVAYQAYQGSLLHYYQLQRGENSLTVQLAELNVEGAELAVQQAELTVSQAENQLRGAENSLLQARANLRMVELQVDRLEVLAPAGGTVLTRSVNPGEVLQAGVTGLTLGLMDQLRVTVYLPEDRYGQVQLGDRASVEVDSFPQEDFVAQVLRIADRAEFTPRNVQTEEERRTTVYAVDLELLDGEGKLKPGMPADVTFPDSASD